MHYRFTITIIFLFNYFLGNFSLFAVFVPGTLPYTRRVDGVIERLMSGIPDKVKFVFTTHLWKPETKLLETLRVAVPFRDEIVLGSMLEILNKRWRKLDLISMMEEFVRFLRENNRNFSMHNTLTSLPRFRKEEDITD